MKIKKKKKKRRKEKKMNEELMKIYGKIWRCTKDENISKKLIFKKLKLKKKKNYIYFESYKSLLCIHHNKE